MPLDRPLRLSTVALALGIAGAAHAATFSTVDMSGIADARFDSPGFINGAAYPDTDTVTLDGIPYLLPSTGLHMWHSANRFMGTAPNPRSLVIPVGIHGVDRAYTLMGTWWGEGGREPSR